MKNMNFAASVASLVLLAGFANAQGILGGRLPDIPECTSIVGQCEKAGFEPGDHKKNGKGLWVDCVHQLALGKTIAGVSTTQAEAKACADTVKSARRARKAAKGK